MSLQKHAEIMVMSNAMYHISICSSPVAFITVFVTVFALVIAITKDLPDVEGDRKWAICPFNIIQSYLEILYIFKILKCLFISKIFLSRLLSLQGIHTPFSEVMVFVWVLVYHNVYWTSYDVIPLQTNPIIEEYPGIEDHSYPASNIF